LKSSFNGGAAGGLNTSKVSAGGGKENSFTRLNRSSKSPNAGGRKHSPPVKEQPKKGKGMAALSRSKQRDASHSKKISQPYTDTTVDATEHYQMRNTFEEKLLGHQYPGEASPRTTF